MTASLARVQGWIENYERVSAVREPVAGRIVSVQDDLIQVESVWTNREPVLKKAIKSTRFSLLNKENLTPVSSIGGRQIGTDAHPTIYSPSGALSATILSQTEGKDEKQFLIVSCTKSQRRLKTIDLAASKKHGKVHVANEFGAFKFSHDEEKILFVAEKLVKPTHFFDPDLDWTDEEKISKANVGEKFAVRESWGEQMPEVKTPVICTLTWKTNVLRLIETDIFEEFSPAQSTWAPEDTGILFVGVKSTPFKLGKIYCSNRPSQLYFYDFKADSFEKIGKFGVGIEGLRVSPCGKRVVWFQRDGTGPHGAGFELWKLDWTKPERTPELLVPLVQKPEKIGVSGTFPGFYLPTLVRQPFSKGQLVVSTLWGAANTVVLVDLTDGKITKLPYYEKKIGSTFPLDVKDGYLLAYASSPARPATLVLADLNAQNIEFKPVEAQDPKVGLEDLTEKWEVVYLKREDGHIYESFIRFPKKEGNFKVPLVVLPHGGPHGCSVIMWHGTLIGSLVASGYAVLQVELCRFFGGKNGFSI
uniref:APEH_N domain-containing protein n=1 Tax=Bursaphelenchus xylophilus TaxID=6326 RepID=A0A1I7RLX4_BURXY